ncbi:unnamed protein product, partial [Heterobilharzia americana]
FFAAEPDDDDENFGGRIVHSLFTDGIFEDPSAQKQLENLTSEIESQMVTTRFGLHPEADIAPIPTSSHEDLMPTGGGDSIVSKPLDAFLTTTTSETTMTSGTTVYIPSTTAPTDTTTPASKLVSGQLQ